MGAITGASATCTSNGALTRAFMPDCPGPAPKVKIACSGRSRKASRDLATPPRTCEPHSPLGPPRCQRTNPRPRLEAPRASFRAPESDLALLVRRTRPGHAHAACGPAKNMRASFSGRARGVHRPERRGTGADETCAHEVNAISGGGQRARVRKTRISNKNPGANPVSGCGGQIGDPCGARASGNDRVGHSGG